MGGAAGKTRAPAGRPRPASHGLDTAAIIGPMTGFILPFRATVPVLDASVYVAPTAAVSGDVRIGAHSSLWFAVVVRGDVNVVRIGSGSNVQDGTVIHVSSSGPGTCIGDDVTIGHMACVHACTVEDAGFVGIKACVLDGAVVESEAMVAAGAVVTPGKRVRRHELWAGVPAKCLRRLESHEIEDIHATAARYRELARAYREEGGPPAAAGA